MGKEGGSIKICPGGWRRRRVDRFMCSINTVHGSWMDRNLLQGTGFGLVIELFLLDDSAFIDHRLDFLEGHPGRTPILHPHGGNEVATPGGAVASE